MRRCRADDGTRLLRVQQAPAPGLGRRGRPVQQGASGDQDVNESRERRRFPRTRRGPKPVLALVSELAVQLRLSTLVMQFSHSTAIGIGKRLGLSTATGICNRLGPATATRISNRVGLGTASGIRDWLGTLAAIRISERVAVGGPVQVG